MKVSCELCRKIFKVSENKLTSRGTTVYCPRCKHGHLVKRVVSAFPVDPEFKIPAKEKPKDRSVQTKEGKASIDERFTLKIGEVPPPPTPEEKPQYLWRKLLAFRRRKKRAQTAKELLSASKGIWSLLMRAMFFVGVIGLVLGYLYYKKVPKAELDIYATQLKKVFDAIGNLLGNSQPTSE